MNNLINKKSDLIGNCQLFVAGIQAFATENSDKTLESTRSFNPFRGLMPDNYPLYPTFHQIIQS